MNTLYPGFCKEGPLDIRLAKNILGFVVLNGRVADVGERNLKSTYLSTKTGRKIEQLSSKDFNFYVPLKNKYDTILCFEIIEHLQNPLFFLSKLVSILNDGGTIYLSTPHRPRFLWTEHHFFEFSPKRLTKWLFTPAGLRVARKKHIRINHDPLFYFKGIRPLFRLFLNYTVIYELKKSSEWITGGDNLI